MLEVGTDATGGMTYTYDAANRLTSVGGVSYTWNVRGSLNDRVLSGGIDGDGTAMKRKYLFIVLLIVLPLSACRSEKSNACGQLLKTEFSEADLIGTWDAIDALRDSTFIIREDGRYKQTMYVERTGFSYEGDWLPWRVEYSEGGFAYLHLEGLLMCAYWRQMDCSTGETNIEPVEVGDTTDPFTGEYYWYDYCREEWVETPGEGVYLVLESGYALREICLAPLTKSASGTSGPTYELRKP